MRIIIAFLIEHALSTQLLLFTTILISLWVIEKLKSGEVAGRKWRHTSVNGLVMLSALPVQLTIGFFLVLLSGWVTAHHWGVLYLLPNPSSPWIKFGLMLLALDFLDYSYHLSMHQVEILWNLHLVHHTDSRVDVSTTFREHPVETALRNCFLMVCVFTLGASPGALILRQTAQTVSNIFSHTSLPLPPILARILGWLFMTPNLHLVHHHFKLPYTDRNYGDLLSVWDRLFGTYAELAAKDTVFGLDTHMDEAITGNYKSVIALPFSKHLKPVDFELQHAIAQ